MEASLGVDRVEDVTAQLLGGASRFEVAAFRMAVGSYLLAVRQPSERAAIDGIWSGGYWRPLVWAWAPLQWELAQRLTAQEAAGEPLEPFPGHGGAAADELRGSDGAPTVSA